MPYLTDLIKTEDSATLLFSLKQDFHHMQASDDPIVSTERLCDGHSPFGIAVCFELSGDEDV